MPDATAEVIPDFTEEISNGIQFLDGRYPDWRENIISPIRMNSLFFCVGAQASGLLYLNFVGVHNLSIEDTERLGFSTGRHWLHLQNQWIQRLQYREHDAI